MYLLKRIFAFIIDSLICGCIVSPVFYILFNESGIYGGLMLRNQLISIVFISCALILYFILFEWLSGNTVGKKMFKLYISSDNEDLITFKRVFIRNILRIIDHVIFPFGLIFIIVTKKKRLGDIVSKMSVEMRVMP